MIDINIYNNLIENSTIIQAESDRLVTDNGKIYYNYFNTGLRWLCGYNNKEINKLIEKDIRIIGKNPNQIKNLTKQISDSLLFNSKKLFHKVRYPIENTYEALNFLNNEDQFFLFLTDKDFYENFAVNSQDFFDLLLEIEVKKQGDYTAEGWSINHIKQLFKNYKKKISALIISPLLLNKSLLISEDTLELLFKLCKKYKILIFWDESLTCFYRTGTFFYLNQLTLKPDLLIINSNIYNNEDMNIILINKKIKNKILDKILDLNNTQIIAKYIVLHSILFNISNKDLIHHIKSISNRLYKKLQALSYNIQNRFYVKEVGLITIIDFKTENYQDKLVEKLKKSNLIVYNSKESLILIPQLILTRQAVDLFIQSLNDFFKSGIKIKNLKSNN